jgi:dATP pyrophosphohydrolase
VLLLERAAHPGFWQSVTGSLEAGERPADAALREVSEETGIRLNASQLVDWRLTSRYRIFPEWRHRYAPGVSENVEHLFSVRLPESVPIRLAPAEHAASRWLPWRQAAAACFSWSNRDAILMLGIDPPPPGLPLAGEEPASSLRSPVTGRDFPA